MVGRSLVRPLFGGLEHGSNRDPAEVLLRGNTSRLGSRIWDSPVGLFWHRVCVAWAAVGEHGDPLAPRHTRPLSVCHVWDDEYPWDVRVEKIARALAAAGHKVSIVARNQTGRARIERLPEASVHRLATWKWAPRWLNAASMFPAFFNPRWASAILTTARHTQADVIVCRDLPLAATAIYAGWRLGLPVMIDNAENYPAMLRSRWDVGRMHATDALVRNPRFARSVERWLLHRVDHMLVVVEEARQRLIALGLPEEKISIVSNTPPRERLQASPSRAHRDGREVHIVYLGLMEEQRGVRMLLEGAAELARRGMACRLTLFGGGRELDDFRRHARALRLSGSMAEFRGPVPNPQVHAALREADIGVIPHVPDESWNTTVPNKLFDYMAAGLAVVTSDARPCARIVRETGAGLVFRYPDARDLADAIQALADPARRAQCAERGQAAIRVTYNWEADSARLLDAIDRVASGCRDGIVGQEVAS